MRILDAISQLNECQRPVALAIGVFDGVHIGHRAVIADASARAQAAGGDAVVVTFKPHPQRILRPDVAPKLLTSTPHKVRILRRMGIRNLLLVPFTAAFAQMPPEEFVYELTGSLGVGGLSSVSVGQSWCFGRKRSGNLDLLRRMGTELGFEVCGIREVEHRGQPVSSTRIRRLIEEGALEEAATLLGRQVSLFGTVVEGDRLGRRLGFPTANIAVQSEQLPPPGVYAAAVRIHDEPLPAVANLGYRPTVAGGSPTLVFEVHILDYTANLYGTELEVDLLGKLREEQKFRSLDELGEQIQRDVEAVRAGFVLPK